MPYHEVDGIREYRDRYKTADSVKTASESQVEPVSPIETRSLNWVN
jgi:hypothetical protein